jgi:hypothetical protein
VGPVLETEGRGLMRIGRAASRACRLLAPLLVALGLLLAPGAARAADPAVNYVRCAPEEESCTPPIHSVKWDLAFGVEGHNWTYLYGLQGVALCDQFTFGVDPDPGKPKECRSKGLPVIGGYLAFCAAEGQICGVSAPADVAFAVTAPEFREGFGEAVLHDVTGPVACTKALFGYEGDPLEEGDCLVKPLTPPAGFSYCAPEGGACTIRAPSDLAFGVGQSYVTVPDITGLIDCNVAAFGSDPAPNTEKDCFARPLPPPPPGSLIAPTVTGAAIVGRTLTATAGMWSGSPTGFAYQWQACDAAGTCTPIPGANNSSFVPVAAEIGKHVQVLVSAANAGGTARASSNLSQSVAGIVEATLRAGFGVARRFSIVEELRALRVPPGGWVEVSCEGKRCPVRHVRTLAVGAVEHCHGKRCPKHPKPQGPTISLERFFGPRHLAVGDRLSIRIVKSGWIGKVYEFTIRSNRRPREAVACLAPGESVPGRAC